MKVQMLKDVISAKGWRKVGEIHDVEQKVANHYIKKGIAFEYVQKEEKAVIETKENKTAKKRVTKKAK